jgi:hypothetical protein
MMILLVRMHGEGEVDVTTEFFTRRRIKDTKQERNGDDSYA